MESSGQPREEGAGRATTAGAATAGEHELEIRDTNDLPVDAIVELYRYANWARTRPAEGVAKMLVQTPLVLTGWYHGRCVAMARALTDGVYLALIADVIVHPEFRGRGWGRRLMEAALAHPKLRDIQGRVSLFTGIPAFYERFDFVRDAGGMRLQHTPRPVHGPEDGAPRR